MLKKIVVTLLISLLATPLLFQTQIANAQNAPITSPITAPVSFFNLKGHIVYHQLGWLWGSMHRFTDAMNVVVKVEGLFHHVQTYQTSTDSHGMYSINVSPGTYEVMVNDTQNTPFAPPIKIAKVKSTSVTQVDFEGLLFPKFNF